nr:MAG TPA: hypothetical protein [Caudoviricetes sp.]
MEKLTLQNKKRQLYSCFYISLYFIYSLCFLLSLPYMLIFCFLLRFKLLVI